MILNERGKRWREIQSWFLTTYSLLLWKEEDGRKRIPSSPKESHLIQRPLMYHFCYPSPMPHTTGCKQSPGALLSRLL